MADDKLRQTADNRRPEVRLHVKAADGGARVCSAGIYCNHGLRSAGRVCVTLDTFKALITRFFTHVSLAFHSRFTRVSLGFHSRFTRKFTHILRTFYTHFTHILHTFHSLLYTHFNTL